MSDEVADSVTSPLVDTLANFKARGWSGGGHFHWYTEDDPKGEKNCPECGIRESSPGVPFT